MAEKQRLILQQKLHIQQQHQQQQLVLKARWQQQDKCSTSKGVSFNQFQARVKAQIAENRKENNGSLSRQGSPVKLNPIEDDQKHGMLFSIHDLIDLINLLIRCIFTYSR